MDIYNKVNFQYDSLEDAFPTVEPGIQPLGSRILVQVRTPKRKTKSGIILTDDTRETELYNTQVAKVIALGPVAFRNRNTLDPWPEGAWFGVGDFVRTPKYGGDRFSVKYGPEDGDEALFVIFNDLDAIAKITGDPLTMKAFI